MRLFNVAICLLSLSLSSVYGSVVGTYTVHGKNPSEGTTYHGILTIVKEGEIYKGHWELSDSISTGVGVRKGNYIAFDFVGEDQYGNPMIGDQLFKIKNNELKGPWVIEGEGTRGVETASRSVRGTQTLSKHLKNFRRLKNLSS